MIAKRMLLLATLIALGLIPPLAADQCGTGTMKGVYAFSGSGLDVVRKAGNPSSGQIFAPVLFFGTARFGGDGLLSGAFTASGNGHRENAAPFKGAYVVNADCTGSLAVIENDGHESHFSMTISDSGKEILAMQTDAGAERPFLIKKQ